MQECAVDLKSWRGAGDWSDPVRWFPQREKGGTQERRWVAILDLVDFGEVNKDGMSGRRTCASLRGWEDAEGWRRKLQSQTIALLLNLTLPIPLDVQKGCPPKPDVIGNKFCCTKYLEFNLILTFHTKIPFRFPWTILSEVWMLLSPFSVPDVFYDP